MLPLLLLAIACGGGVGHRSRMAEARFDIVNASGEKTGEAIASQTEGGVVLRGRVRGLPPGERAMHIHERGVCQPPGFASAGAHLNPSAKAHGVENPAGPHLGDLGNIVVKSDGSAEFTEFVKGVTVGRGSSSLFGASGAALVIHAAPDDRRTDPHGNAGSRIACGVIAAPRT